jgi:CRISPR/Cas system-associated exonuclease Cas4 (RecB family)
LVSPSENLIEKVAELLRGVEKDYSSNLLVFPGKRPSHFLRKALAKKEKSSFIPPLLFSMDEFIDHVHDESMGFNRPKLETIDTLSILYSIHTAFPDYLGSRHFLTPDHFFPIGLKMYHDLEELHIEDVSPKKVKEIDTLAEEKIPEPTARRLQSLSFFYETFYREVEEKKFSTRSSRYRIVAAFIDRLNLGRFDKVIFSGFFALTKSEKDIFRSLMERKNTVFIFQEGEGIKKKLSDLGILGKNLSKDSGPKLHFYRSPDTHGQVLGVSALLKNRIEKGEVLDENTAIVLPSSETLIPLLHQALSLLDPEDYNISLGYPLLRTPLYGFFHNLMEVVTSMDRDRLYVPYYLEFILHPYTKNIYFEGRPEGTRILFHAIEMALTEKKTKKFLSLSELEQDEGIIRSIQERVVRVEPGIPLKKMREHLETIHTQTLRKMCSIDHLGDFARKLKGVVEYISRNSTACLHPFFYPYSESFLTCLDVLSRSLMKETRFDTTGGYFTFLKKYVEASYTPFPGTPLRGVQVLGFLETRNLKFDQVLFLDANEGILPDTGREDSFLPLKARQILGLPTLQDREEILSYAFDVLIQGAKEVHLFYAENDEKEKSRWVEKLLWEKQKREGKPNDKSFVRTIPYSVSLKHAIPHPIHKSEQMVTFLKGYPFSATSLNTYLFCPLQFYYEYVLGLREREGIPEEFEKEEIGSFVHLVLYDYFKNKTGSILSGEEFNPGEFEKIIRKHFGEKYGKDLTGEHFLLRNQIVRHLKDFILNYQIPKVKEFRTRILGLEQHIEVVQDSFRLKARLDRVEKRGDRTAIIDYKTSANKQDFTIRHPKLDLKNRDSWSEGIGTLQLPFYLITYSAATGEEEENIDCIFLLLGKTRIDTAIEVPLFKDQNEFKEKFDGLRQILFRLLREIVDPGQPFLPTHAPKHRCGGCLYRHLCTNETSAGTRPSGSMPF